MGNQHRRTHGAYAAVAVDRLDVKAREVFDALAADAPLRDGGELPAADGAAVRLAAEVLCRLDSVGDYLARRGIEDAAGALREGVLDLERRLRAEAADHLDSLGMTPRSRARLGLDVARAGVDLAALWAEQAHEDDRAASDAIDGTAADG
ncbi:MAG: hypothetical protein WKF96_11935 [Solirubrobacteraceae bacterium]